MILARVKNAVFLAPKVQLYGKNGEVESYSGGGRFKQ